MSDHTVLVQKPSQVIVNISTSPSKTVSSIVPKQGLSGPKGDRGEKGDKGDIGPEGPEYQGDDLPDFTLIFENKLI